MGGGFYTKLELFYKIRDITNTYGVHTVQEEDQGEWCKDFAAIFPVFLW